MKKSIYEIILENIQEDGKLPENFSLPKENKDNTELNFAPGALDGIHIYHFGIPDEEIEKAKVGIKKAIDFVSQEEIKKANKEFEKIFKKDIRAIDIIDEICSCIQDNSENLDPQKIFAYGYYLILDSKNVELVKVGLILMELLEPHLPEEVNETIKILGLYDEFTIFSIFNLRHLPNGNDFIFEYAQKLNSWGKVHAVERLQPKTKKIKDWILHNGMSNSVLNEYLALTCYQKAEVEKRLKTKITKKEFDSIGKIIANLFPEGPVAGISAIENDEEILTIFVEHAQKQNNLTVGNLNVIYDIKDYAEENEYKKLKELCDVILDNSKTKETIKKAVKKGEGIYLAKKLNIPFEEDLIKIIDSDFENRHGQIGVLIETPKYIDRLVEIFKKHIDLKQIEQNPSDEIGLPKNNIYLKLALFLQYFKDFISEKYPKEIEDILLKTVASKSKNNRFQTMYILKNWVKREGKSIEELSPELFKKLKSAVLTEPNAELKTELQNLIDNKISFEEEEE